MPVYLLHGFRWPRPLIRIHIILQNLDDAAAEWLVAPGTTSTILENFHELFPDAMQHLPMLRLIEQYDPNDTSSNSGSQPYAYVADIVEEIKLGIDVEEARSKGVGNEQWTAMMELRDRLAPEGKVGWYVVVCGDEERWAPPTMGLLNSGGPHGVRGGGSETDSAYYTNKPSVEVGTNVDVWRGQLTDEVADQTNIASGVRAKRSSQILSTKEVGIMSPFVLCGSTDHLRSRASSEPFNGSPVESAPPLPVSSADSRYAPQA